MRTWYICKQSFCARVCLMSLRKGRKWVFAEFVELTVRMTSRWPRLLRDKLKTWNALFTSFLSPFTRLQREREREREIWPTRVNVNKDESEEIQKQKMTTNLLLTRLLGCWRLQWRRCWWSRQGFWRRRWRGCWWSWRRWNLQKQQVKSSQIKSITMDRLRVVDNKKGYP